MPLGCIKVANRRLSGGTGNLKNDAKLFATEQHDEFNIDMMNNS